MKLLSVIRYEMEERLEIRLKRSVFSFLDSPYIVRFFDRLSISVKFRSVSFVDALPDI